MAIVEYYVDIENDVAEYLITWKIYGIIKGTNTLKKQRMS